MKLIQYCENSGTRRVGMVENPESVRAIQGFSTLYELAWAAVEKEERLEELVLDRLSQDSADYDDLICSKRLLPPAEHPDHAHCLVTGTGLTHLGSADARDRMHQKSLGEEELTDSMKIFRMGLEGGKPGTGQIGVQPEWFYKGDGSCVVAPEQELSRPLFAEDGGEEPELVGIYLIGPDGSPYRLGFSLGNEFSDHVTERRNYLYLAHSKLRDCSVGPELRTGSLPTDIRGFSRIRREGKVIWEKPFLSAEANMSHSIANLEHHHFKYARFRKPGDLHLHFFGTATLSFSDGIRTQIGDVFEIEAEGFGKALRNPMREETPSSFSVHPL